MKLQENEQILRVFHHHPFFFVTRGVKIWLASIPFFFVAALLSYVVDIYATAYLNIGVVLLFCVVHLYDFLIYYMDALVVTNRRVVHLDWLSLFKYVETQAMLNDIQNITTQENGLLSRLEVFDFGLFVLETSSTKTTLTFNQAPDPEGIKFFLYNLAKEHVGIKEKAGEEAPAVEKFIRKMESNLNKVEK